jgi:hypothetical protein
VSSDSRAAKPEKTLVQTKAGLLLIEQEQGDHLMEL